MRCFLVKPRDDCDETILSGFGNRVLPITNHCVVIAALLDAAADLDEAWVSA